MKVDASQIVTLRRIIREAESRGQEIGFRYSDEYGYDPYYSAIEIYVEDEEGGRVCTAVFADCTFDQIEELLHVLS